MGDSTVVIIGAGPAGLTAAYELVTRSSHKVIILELEEFVGGISRTVNYKGNRIDIGGHRFFSKSDKVMEWWFKHLPREEPTPSRPDQVMLVRERRSRIYFLRQFFDYPISLSADTIRKLGIFTVAQMGLSYLRARLAPIRPETSLQEFFINRFGRKLYKTFFKSYTEKVWGVPCDKISAEWGSQRIKGLSISKALTHALGRIFRFRETNDVLQKKTETSLIERFLYPKFGPGQMWETVAASVIQRGGQILHGWSVDRVHLDHGRVAAIESVHRGTGERRTFPADYFLSTMPIKDLIRAMGDAVPPPVKAVSEGLVYRDFLTVGILVPGLKIRDVTKSGSTPIRDNWIYIQEPDVKVGRLQIFNNWSPFMVADPSKTWIGMEYFCNETDDLWKLPDPQLIQFAADELHKIHIIDKADVLDATVIRVAKTYPAYFGSYNQFPILRDYINTIPNLFLVGRNGMHKYNNQDHSMLTAMAAADMIMEGKTDKSHIWEINTERVYHEEKKP